ncbi:MAG: 30S ribosomal protein S17 [Nanobdellota archaeon]
MAKKTKNIGVNVQFPEKECTGDKNCPFHGERNIRGKTVTGKVVKSKLPLCVTVEYTGKRYIPKYERYKRIRTRLKAHNPECIAAQDGDKVLVMETRKISKTKNFVVIQKLEE